MSSRPRKYDGIDQMFPRSRLDDTDDVEHHDDILSRFMVAHADVLKQLSLDGGKFKVVFHGTVGSFACDSSQDHYGHVVVFGLTFNGFQRNYWLGAVPFVDGTAFHFFRC